MPVVAMNTTAPNFTLTDFRGKPIALADFIGKANVLLVFNRGFT